ncbi:MAG TPA: hypothetical protein VH250_12125 [Granulicella sp.]|nr:hypothetical protein [Granulicella sp.]
MIAFAALAGTMVATKAVPSSTAAAGSNEDSFPAALQGIAQAVSDAQPLARDAKTAALDAKTLAPDAKTVQGAASPSMVGHAARSHAISLVSAEGNGAMIPTPAAKEGAAVPANTRAHLAADATQPNPTAMPRDQNENANADVQFAPTWGTTSASGGTASAPQAATLDEEEGQAPVAVKAATAEATKRTMPKAQVTPRGASHSAHADHQKMVAGGAPHTEGATLLSPATDALPGNTALSGEARETPQPTPNAPHATGDQGAIVFFAGPTNAAATKTSQQHAHATGKAGSAHTAGPTASDADSGISDPTLSGSDTAAAAGSVAKLQPDGAASFKAELSVASHEVGGHVVSAPAALAANPPASSHSAGAASKTADLAQTGVESTVSGEASYSGTLGRESHGTLLATPTTLEVGVSRGAEGWLKIRAEVGSDGISASLSTVSHAGQSTLREQLPAINAFLQGEQIHASATVADKALQWGTSDGSSSAAMDRGFDQEGRAPSEQRQLSQSRDTAAELPEDSHSPSLQSGVGVLLSGSTRAGASLSVLA